MKMEGYPVAIFESGFTNKFICGLCKKILREPLQSFCGHRFCNECVKRALGSSGSVSCPCCREENMDENEFTVLKNEQMFPDNAVKREMIRMPSKCANNGCTWKGDFKAYQEHEQNCEHRTVPCAECGALITFLKRNEHLTKECPKRQVKCRFCNANIIYADTEHHNVSCPKFPSQCASCGKKKIPKDQMQEHLQKECNKRAVQCPLGCPDSPSLSRFQSHLAKNVGSHLAWVMERLHQLEQQITGGVTNLTPNRDLREVMSSITELEQKVNSMESQLQSINNFSAFQERLRITEAKVESFEPIMGVLHREIDKCVQTTESLGRGGVSSLLEQQITMMTRQMEEFKTKIQTLERSLAMKEVALTEHELRMQSLEFVSYDGTLLWRIGEVKKKRQEAAQGTVTSLYSQAFYTGKVGYKMCARIYLNGDGIGKGTHISLFFVVMRGPYDSLLPWPFKQKVSLMIIDQNFSEHVLDTFQPDVGSSSFRRPVSEMNIASGCPLFLPLTRLDDPTMGYVKDDVIFIKIIVETDGLAKYTELNPLKANGPVAPPGSKR